MVNRAWRRGHRGTGRSPRRGQVIALIARIEEEQGKLDILVNDIWGGDRWRRGCSPILGNGHREGLRLLRTPSVPTSSPAAHALPLMLENKDGLVSN